MKKPTKTYYSIKIIPSIAAPAKLQYQAEHDELFLSPNGVLVGTGKMAHLASHDLAERFLEAYMPRLKKRYGDDVETLVASWQGTDSKRLADRIAADSALAEKRLGTGILAANKRP